MVLKGAGRDVRRAGFAMPVRAQQVRENALLAGPSAQQRGRRSNEAEQVCPAGGGSGVWTLAG